MLKSNIVALFVLLVFGSFKGFSQATIDFESLNSGFSSKAFSDTNGGYQNLVSGNESVINDYSMAPEPSTTFALSGGLTFDFVSLKVAEVSVSLTFTTDKSAAIFFN